MEQQLTKPLAYNGFTMQFGCMLAGRFPTSGLCIA